MSLSMNVKPGPREDVEDVRCARGYQPSVPKSGLAVEWRPTVHREQFLPNACMQSVLVDSETVVSTTTST
jgi:hypothetical protein